MCAHSENHTYMSHACAHIYSHCSSSAKAEVTLAAASKTSTMKTELFTTRWTQGNYLMCVDAEGAEPNVKIGCTGQIEWQQNSIISSDILKIWTY